jgi:hypothetical protein
VLFRDSSQVQLKLANAQPLQSGAFALTYLANR